MPEPQDLGLDDLAAALLRAQIRARQENHADGEVPAARLVPGAADMLLEEVLRNLHVDARAIAGLAVRIHRAAMPQRLERLDALEHDLAPRLAVDGHDHADAAGIVFLCWIIGMARLQQRCVPAPTFDEVVHSMTLQIPRRRARAFRSAAFR